MSRPLRIGAVAAIVLAALSLLAPYHPVYDPWGWLVWGRELTRLELATASGPSWKPLPALVDAPLSLLGAAAPQAWLLVARSGWLLAPLLAAGLAARLSGEGAGRWRYAAAALAAASVALTGDAFTPPARQFTGGLSEPLLVALVLAAVTAALARRPGPALWLGVAAALLRPECWPFLAAWALYAVRREPRLRGQALAAALLVPLAWFLPDLLAAGNPLEGSQTARQGGIELDEIRQVAGRALAAPLAAIWLGVALFAAGRDARRRPDRVLTTLLVAALAWVALVAAMAVAGFAGLPRFLAPATAAIAVVGAVGIARAGAGFAAGRSAPLTAVAGLALAVGAIQLGVRAAELPADLRDVDRQAMLVDGMFELAEQVPAERLLSCGDRVRLANLVAPPTALAWKLDRPLASVRVMAHPRYGMVLSTRPVPGRPVVRVGRWRATRLPC